jgi:K+-sensing histidine kinase KdpD
MLVIAVVIGTQTIRSRLQAAHAVDRESRTQALYRLARELTGDHRDFDAARIAIEITREVFGCRVVTLSARDAG